jgi:epoxyqueuosine reductase QueG
MSQPKFSAAFAGSPTTRAQRRWLACEAPVALGNIASENDVSALTAAPSDEEPLVRRDGT